MKRIRRPLTAAKVIGFFSAIINTSCCISGTGTCSVASEIQKDATNKIARSISIINELTQANVADAEKISSNVIDVSQITETLHKKVNNFRKNET